MVDPLLVLTGLILGMVGLVSFLLGWTHRISVRVAVRNMTRARSRTVLAVLGLLVGTAIISGSLAVGDTVVSVNYHFTYLSYGYADEEIWSASSTGTGQFFSAAVASQLIANESSNPLIAGITPMVVARAQVYDHNTGVPQTNLHLIGSDPNQSKALGPFTTTSGQTLLGPSPGMVLLDQYAATQLGAAAGDTVVVYGAVPLTTAVQAVVHDDVRGAFMTEGLRDGAVFVDLSTAQRLENASGLVNEIVVTNVGSQADGVTHSSAVSAQLNSTLATIPGAAKLSSHTGLQDELQGDQTTGQGLVTIFLVFGLFSILAGAMLIVGIFTMTAEERKGEMGMLRAIGFTRRDVVLSYYFEGLIYSLGSAVAGVLVGVATGYVLLWAYVLLVGSNDVGTVAVLSSFTVSASSLYIAYLAGFLLTLGTVAIASVRVSRLNIIRAIRDVPEPPPPLRTYTFLAYLGAAASAIGAGLFLTTFQGSSDYSFPMVAGGLIILGAGLLASRFVKNRPVFTVVGVGLMVWAGLQALQNAVLGTSHAGTIFVLFVEGIELIAGAVLVFAFNGPQIAVSVERGLSGRVIDAPVARMGFAYPSRRAVRTALTTTIFALVLFVIVVLAVYSATLTGNLNDSISDQSGGYTFFGHSTIPIANFSSKVAANSSLAGLYSNIVPLTVGVGYLSGSGFGQSQPYPDNVYAAPAGGPPSANFYSTNHYTFQSTLGGMSAASVMAALESNRSVAIVDGSYGGAGFSTSSHPSLSVGSVVRIADPGTGNSTNVTVVGVMKQLILTGIWLNPVAAQHLGFTSQTGYLLAVNPGVSPTTASQKTNSAFYPDGLVLVEFTAVLSSATAVISGEIGLLEVFIGLGLAVGIAALGIVAHRAVVERRREIGMLRATGLTRGMILKMFLLEYSFVTLIGSAIGALAAMLLMYNFVTSPGAASADVTKLYVPWLNLLVVVAVTATLAVLAVLSPSRRAARLAPAEAIRGTE
jgi:putative ABC transport system permease protein